MPFFSSMYRPTHLMSSNTAATPASDSAEGTARTTYHANLKTLTDSPAFKALATSGKVTISVASAALASSAKTDFGAFLSLNALSPIVLSTGGDAAATATLQAAHPSLYADWNADKNARLYGDTTQQPAYSDHWYTDRAAMLQVLVTRNQQDVGGIVPGSQNLLYQDVASNTEVLVGAGSTSATGKRLPVKKHEQKMPMAHAFIGLIAMGLHKTNRASCKPTKTRAMNRMQTCANGIFDRKTNATRLGGMGRLA